MKTYTPAFPIGAGVENAEDWKHGMMLRDWFAGQAIAGILASNDKGSIERVALRLGISPGQAACRVAYDTAEHMMEERNRRHHSPSMKEREREGPSRGGSNEK